MEVVLNFEVLHIAFGKKTVACASCKAHTRERNLFMAALVSRTVQFSYLDISFYKTLASSINHHWYMMLGYIWMLPFFISRNDFARCPEHSMAYDKCPTPYRIYWTQNKYYFCEKLIILLLFHVRIDML